jgi:hypothetical protein
VHSDIKKECKYFPERIHDKKFLLESSKRRNKIGYDLVTAAGMITFYFGDEIREKIENLNNYDAAMRTEEICSKNLENDADYGRRQAEIERIAEKIIVAERNRI